MPQGLSYSSDVGWEASEHVVTHDDPIDFVNDPPHYSSLDPNQPDLECIDAQKAMVGPDGFEAHCKCQAAKYLWRAGRKRHDREGTVEDLKKCRFYVNELIRIFSESED